MGLLSQGLDKLMGTKTSSEKRGRHKTVSSDPSQPATGGIRSMKRGGRVKRTGMHRLHKGERVLTRKQSRRYRSKR